MENPWVSQILENIVKFFYCIYVCIYICVLYIFILYNNFIIINIIMSEYNFHLYHTQFYPVFIRNTLAGYLVIECILLELYSMSLVKLNYGPTYYSKK